MPLPLADYSGLFGFKYRNVEPGQSRHKMKPEAWRHGTENRVLAGAPVALQSETLRTILIEVDGVKWTNVSGQLENAGFVLDTRIEREKQSAPTYGLFVRPARSTPERSPWWTFLRNPSQQ